MANTYDKASLVLIPSGTKEGVVFSQKPTNGDGDFTFSRSTAATRVNADGLIEKETQNLLLQSNSFDTTWLANNASLASGQSGYDGTSDAFLLESTSNAGRIYQNASISGVITYSVYAKAGSVDWMALYINASPTPYCFFDLANVALGTDVGGNSVARDIVDVGNGWVRCSVSFMPNGSTTDFRIFPATNDNGLGISGSNIYIQDAQVNYGLVADSYLETTDSAVYGGMTDNIPRLDYNGSCPSLLLEPQRTNLLVQSEYFGAWSAFGGAVLTHNDAISPEGISNAVKMSTNGVFKQDPTAANTDYVFSVFAKTNTATSVVINYIDQTSPYRGGTIIYTFATDAVAVTGQSENNSVTAEREDYGNGWIRVIMNFKTNVAKNYNYQEIRFIGGDGWIYGAQYEAGSYATSYIPTYGSAAVTRNQDACSVTGVSDLIGQTEGTIFLDINNRLLSPYPNEYVFYITGTGGNQLWLRKESGGGNFTARLVVGGSNVWTIPITPPDGLSKIALAYKSGDSVVYLNGTQVNTSSATFSGNVLEDFYFSSVASGYPELKLNQTLLFKTRLTNEELAALTTI